MSTQTQPIGDQRKADGAEEHEVEFLEAREDAAEAREAPEQSLNFIAAFVHLALVLPGLNPGPQWQHDVDEAWVECQLQRLVAFTGSVHEQMQRPVQALALAC